MWRISKLNFEYKMRKIKVVILDDEKSSLELLSMYVGRIPNVELVADFQSPRGFLDWDKKKNEYDLLISDVDMLEMSGIEVSKMIEKAVIFTSGKFSQFANPLSEADLHQSNIIGQIPKPLQFDLLEKAMAKFAFPKEPTLLREFINLKAIEGYVLLAITEIQLISTKNFEKPNEKIGSGNKWVYRTNAIPILITDISLENILAKLPKYDFFIISDSCLIQKRHISRYTKSEVWLRLNIDKKYYNDENKGCCVKISEPIKEKFLAFLEA